MLFKKGKQLQEVVYYISGWLICAIWKESARRSSKEIGKWLDVWARNYSIDRDVVVQCDLPVGEVDHMMSYGGLTFTSKEFYFFICRVNMCFSSLLTNKNITAHGPMLNNNIMIYIQSCVSFQQCFPTFLMFIFRVRFYLRSSNMTHKHLRECGVRISPGASWGRKVGA